MVDPEGDLFWSQLDRERDRDTGSFEYAELPGDPLRLPSARIAVVFSFLNPSESTAAAIRSDSLSVSAKVHPFQP